MKRPRLLLLITILVILLMQIVPPVAAVPDDAGTTTRIIQMNTPVVSPNGIPNTTDTSLAGNPAADNSLVSMFYDNGNLVEERDIGPGLPPPGWRRNANIPDLTAASTRTLSATNVPALDWSYGCAATSAAMYFGYFDRIGYPNFYTGPTDGGKFPLTNDVWGEGECPLSASHNGIDGRTTKGHVDDYWFAYKSYVDPYYLNWSEHSPQDSVGDYLGTNQFQNWRQTDGSTKIFFNWNGTPKYDYTLSEALHKRDFAHGMKLFAESRGYDVSANYNQLIYGYSGNTEGFTYNQYKSEINAGYPVFIVLDGHMMLGVGYSGTDTIIIHDTWDYSEHTMTWGGSYGGMKHLGVTVVHLSPFTGPTITSVSPASGPTAGGTSILINGTNFTSGGSFGVTVGGMAATSVVRVNATTITAVTPGGPAGAKDIVVTNNDGQRAILFGGFTYLRPPPTITRIYPTSGSTGGGTAITITGTNFRSGGSFRVLIGGNRAYGADRVSATQVTASTPSGTAGQQDVVVVNDDGQRATLAGGFRYVRPPGITSISPDHGPTTGGTTVTITGTNFVSGVSYGVNIGNVPATGVVRDSATQITAVTPAGTAGEKMVYVTNKYGRSEMPAYFTYNAPPGITNISPASGPTAGGTAITINGAEFWFGGPLSGVKVGGINATSVVRISKSRITAVTPAGTAGARDIVITNWDGQTATLTGGFTYVAPPTITTVSPPSGPTAGGTNLTITGSNFIRGGSFRVTVGGVEAADVVRVSSGRITAHTPAGTAGAKDIVVTNKDGQTATLTGGFMYTAPPAITGVSPPSGPTAGGTILTINGTNFVAGGLFSVKVGGVPATGVVRNSATRITAITPVGAAGAKDVVVTNRDGQKATLPGGFTYRRRPTITSVSPVSGPIEGGTVITINGTNFVAGGAFGVKVGGVPATGVVRNSATRITAVTPAGTAGAKDVSVTSEDGQTVTLAGGFTYRVRPTITSITPASGPTAGNTTITITGTNFVAGGAFGVTVGGVEANGAYRDSATRITAITPAGTAGTKDVVVTSGDGQTATRADSFTYIAPPAITSVSPASGTTAGGTPVTITGTNFISGGAFRVNVGGEPATGVVRHSATLITAITPAGMAGAKNVVVFNNDGQKATKVGGFTYSIPPAITGVSPASGTTAGGTTITITGSDFVSGGAFGVKVGGVAATGVVRNSATQITAVTPAGSTGAKDVAVTNNDGLTTTRTNAFTYIAPPAITNISPVSGPTTGGTPITITGSDFVSGGAFGVKVGGVAATGVVRNSATKITAVTPVGSAGAKDVVVTNNDGQKATMTGGFTYRAPPTITSVSPVSGTTAGGTAITINGTNFVAGGLFGVKIGGAAATGVVRDSATRITAITPAGTVGGKDVVVTNNDGQTATRTYGFTYKAPPTITSISPASGPTTGGTTITINGTNFVSGGSFGVMIGGNRATSVIYDSPLRIRATTPPDTAGPKDVIVTNNDGQNATLTNGFTYLVPPPGLKTGGMAATTPGVTGTTNRTDSSPARTGRAGNVVVTNRGG